MIDMTADAPVLPAYPTAHGWRGWCRYGKRWHQHSAQPGHRAARCYVGNGPYRQTGYILALAEQHQPSRGTA